MLIHGLENPEEIRDRLVDYAISGKMIDDIKSKLVEVLGIGDQNRNTDRDDDGFGQTLAERGLLPMSNMPTEVTTLYHRMPNWRIGQIDRPVEQAITMFAPGMQITKDKKKYEVIGLTGDINLDHTGRRKAHIPHQRRPWNWKDELLIDKETNALLHVGDLANYTGRYPTNPMQLTGIKPAGFRTRYDLLPVDPWSGGTSGGSFSLMYHQSANELGTEERNYRSQLDIDGMVYLINDNRGQGYSFRYISDRGNPNNHLNFQLIEDGVFDTVFQNGRNGLSDFTEHPSQNQDGSPEYRDTALVSPKSTDVFWVHPATQGEYLQIDRLVSNAGVNRRERRTGILAAYRSAAHLIRSAICDRLDVDPRELQIAELAPVDIQGETRVSRIVIADLTPNGSGFSSRLSEEFDGMLEALFGRGDIGDWRFLESLHEGHQRACNTSCNECIRNFSNMREHALMDWRLGISMLRLMYDPSEVLMADKEGSLEDECSELQGKSHELSNLVIEFRDIQNRLLQAGGPGLEPMQFGDLPGVFDGNRNRAFMIVHPLCGFRRTGGCQ